jgi:DNA-binding beta-propeller fold protein YncE
VTFRLLLALAILFVSGAVTAVAVASDHSAPDSNGQRSDYEVWLVDQSNSRGSVASGHGGYLYIYKQRDLERNGGGASPERIDLGAKVSEMCKARTDSVPKRPHMVVFNGGASSAEGGTDAALAFVASGHVVFFDTETRLPTDCVDTGAQAHAVWPTPDQRHLIVANQNDKKLSRISTDYGTDTFTPEAGAAIDLANGTTPSGAQRQDPALRPDNAPICPRTDDSGKVTFVSLRGGGAFVVDHKASPMRIVAEYDKDALHANGCGYIQKGDKMYANSGAGTVAGNPGEHDVYSLPVDEYDTQNPAPPNTPAPELVYSHDERGDVDSHGVLLTKHGKYLWVGDRIQNTVSVVRTKTDELVNEFPLATESATDVAPDLMDISPDKSKVFVATRGPSPQSGGHAAFGNSPGLGVIDVKQDGRDGQLEYVARVGNVIGGTEQADPHAVRVREIPRR